MVSDRTSDHTVTTEMPRHHPSTRVGDDTPEPGPASRETAWCLYLIECANGAWYAGITNDITRRYAAHAAGRGARYTRANPPCRLLGTRTYPDRSAAARAEYAIRRLPKQRKLAFLQNDAAANAAAADAV